MKKELSMSGKDYTDSVAFQLLHFLNDKIDSPEEDKHGYSDLEYPNQTQIHSFWDDSQAIGINGREWGYGEIVWLDNNQLLIVIDSLPIWDMDNNSYFNFSLLPNADKIILKKEKNSQDEDIIELCNGEETVFIFDSVYEDEAECLPNNKKVVSLIEPTSFDQILDRGYTGPISKPMHK